MVWEVPKDYTININTKNELITDEENLNHKHFRICVYYSRSGKRKATINRSILTCIANPIVKSIK